MGVGDLCYKSGGDLAYSKTDSLSLIYRGTWWLRISWTGSYNNGQVFEGHSATYSTANRLTTCRDIAFNQNQYGVFLCQFIIDPSSNSPFPDLFTTLKHTVHFMYYDFAYGNHFSIRAFTNDSEDPSDAYSQIYTNPSKTVDIADVEVTAGFE